MKKIKLILIIAIFSGFFYNTNVKAISKTDKEYINCKEKCDKKYSKNATAYSACISKCNAKLDETYESQQNLKETLKETKSPIQFCAKTATIWQIVGYVFLIVKIVIPLLLIILGVVDLSKAVIGGKDDELKKSMKSMMWRAISAVIIFFVPTIVNIVMNLISNFSESGAKADYKVCQACILSPNSKECDTSKDAGKR